MQITIRRTKNIFEKVKGLIGSENPEAILIQTRFGIHTFGLKFPIDVLILDHTNRVSTIKQGLKPNRIFLWNPKYDKILELPMGFIKEKGIKRGAILTLSFR